MEMTIEQRMSQARSMVEYMAKEIENNMAKHIYQNITNNVDDIYAIRTVIGKNLIVMFQLLNTVNNTTAYKIYDCEKFCKICSHVETMVSTFTKLAEDLVKAVDKPSAEPVEIKDSIFEI